MGLLSKGTPLDWAASQRYHAYVKQAGIKQFLNIYKAQKDRADDQFLWYDGTQARYTGAAHGHRKSCADTSRATWVSHVSSTQQAASPSSLIFVCCVHVALCLPTAPASRGDEVEHLLIRMDPAMKRVQLSLRAAEIIDKLEEAGSSDNSHSNNVDAAGAAAAPKSANFLPEYGRFMIEATPSRPYGGFTADLRMVEQNMRERRAQIASVLHPNERLITLTSFPLMGVGDDFAFCESGPVQPVAGSVADSDYITDSIIGAHPRFATLSRNIRTRRGSRVDIRVPLFQDENTAKDMAAEDAREQAHLAEVLRARRSADLPPHPPRPADVNPLKEIHMDAMAFGMGCACLQVTFQTRSLSEARHLYDHLGVFAPIMLALTAATPFFRGRVADIDVRWTVISQSVDDRTKVEKGLENNPDGSAPAEFNISGAAVATPAAAAAVAAAGAVSAAVSSSSSSSSSSSVAPSPSPSPDDVADPAAVAAAAAAASAAAGPQVAQRLYKSRYDSISTYLSLEDDFKSKYNDLPCEIDPVSYRALLDAGLDELLARHVAHLFVRDPLVIYDEHVLLDDSKSSDHFENLQSTNWQSVRFKPPTAGSSIGWRVEFRTMEVQLTDFENAAFTVFIALVSRALLYFNLNFYIPLSKVDENMGRAHKRDAVLEQTFWWRNNIKLCSKDNGKDNKNATGCASPPPVAAASSASSAASSSASPVSNGTANGTTTAEDDSSDDSYSEMSIRDILLGTPDALNNTSGDGAASPAASGGCQPGLLNLVRTYLDMIQCDAATRRIVDAYLDLISARCTGELMTGAAWLRAFANAHPAYAHNSLLSHELVYDLVETCNQVTAGTIDVPQLLGQHSNRPRAASPPRNNSSTNIKISGTDTGAAAAAEESIELKGAPRAAASAPPAAAAGSGVKGLRPSAHSFDLTEDQCCEKLRKFLTPYLQASATNTLQRTPSKVQLLGFHSNSAASLVALQANGQQQLNGPGQPWVSPPPMMNAP
jgi:glutamate--cysteine ligase catalytic subunit